VGESSDGTEFFDILRQSHGVSGWLSPSLSPHSSSASRFIAGAAGFFILSQSGERPER
jgi:hypothetical protein